MKRKPIQGQKNNTGQQTAPNHTTIAEATISNSWCCKSYMQEWNSYHKFLAISNIFPVF